MSLFYDFCVISGGREGLLFSTLLSRKGFDVLLLIIKNTPEFFLSDLRPLHISLANIISDNAEGGQKLLKLFEILTKYEVVTGTLRVPVESKKGFLYSYLSDCGYNEGEIPSIKMEICSPFRFLTYWESERKYYEPESYLPLLISRDWRNSYSLLKEIALFYRVEIKELDSLPQILNGRLIFEGEEIKAKRFVTDLPPSSALKLLNLHEVPLSPRKNVFLVSGKFQKNFSSSLSRKIVSFRYGRGGEIAGIFLISPDRLSFKAQIFSSLKAEEKEIPDFLNELFFPYGVTQEVKVHEEKVYHSGERVRFLHYIKRKKILYCGPLTSGEFILGNGFIRCLKQLS